MQTDKNLQLVKAIEKCPCLYNHNLFEYLRKDVTEDAWNCVAKHTQLTVSECKEKWKNLRYGLLRSLRPNADGTVKKKYYLHDEMEFVLPFIKSHKHDSTTQPIDELVVDNEQESEHSTSYPTCEELEFSEPPEKKTRLKEASKKLRQNTVHNFNYNNHDIDDSRKMFLLSLLPEVKVLTELQMREFRRKVLALLDEITDVDNPSHYGMCLLECNESPDNSQTVIIKKEPL